MSLFFNNSLNLVWLAERLYRAGDWSGTPGRVEQDYAQASPAPRTPPSPRQPDWLLVLIIGLVLLTLLIAWFADIPAVLR